MAGTTVADLSGLFKEVYGDAVINLVPDSSVITKKVAFVSKDQQNGNLYHQPVIVQPEHGVTYAGPLAGAFTLNGAITMKMQDAQIAGSQMVLRSTMDYESAARASAGGKRAFRSATELQVENMLESIGKRLEIGLLYGQTDLGTVTTSVNTSATVTVLQLTTATWSSGIWSGMENAQISLFKTSDGSLLNSNAACVITVVDTINKKLTISGNATDIAAIDTHLGSGDAAVNFYGARTAATTYAEAAGFDKIITNTGSLFNISASTYDLWRSNTYSAGSAALTFGKLQSAVAVAVGRGLNEDVDVLVNPVTWANLNSDQAALRMYDGSYDPSKGVSGNKELVFHGQNGAMNVVAHPFVKEGEAFIVPMKRAKRIGATDITFNTPGHGGEIFRQLVDSAGFEFRTYSNQGLILETPAKAVKITSIVNS